MSELTANAATATSVAPGDAGWLNPQNAQGAADATSTAASLSAANGTSESLNLAFDLSSLPDNAVIAGVELVLRWRDLLGNSRDASVQLYHDGAPLGEDQADGLHQPGGSFADSDAWGGSSSTWGVADLVPAIVKAAGFSVRVQLETITAANAVAEIDAATLTVTYTTSAIDAGGIAAGMIDAGVVEAGTIDA